MKSENINKIFEAFHKKDPDPKTELASTNHYTLLVAVVLSAQSTDIGVNKATKELFKIVHTPEEILSLGEGKLKQYIKTIGLFNTKAKNIINLSRKLVDEYHSQVPSSLEELIKLPGVGTKTAKVVLNAAFKKPVIAVDTHVFRTSVRIGLSNKKTIKSVEEDLPKHIPDKWKLNAHHWLVLHGRYICKARTPLCSQCPISEYCKKFLKDEKFLSSFKKSF